MARRSRLMACAWTGEVPYEERTVNDEPLFASLPDRATPLIKDWGFVPFLPQFWAEACRQSARTPLLGERLVAARRTWERRWGCHNLELPVSQLCRTEPFAWFACHLLSDCERFHDIYNRCIQAYRRRYGIRRHRGDRVAVHDQARAALDRITAARRGG